MTGISAAAMKIGKVRFKFLEAFMRQHTSRGALLASNLPQLQNLIKRDPVGYKDDFLQQWNHYNSIREIFQTNPDEQTQHLRELTSFLSQVAPCYPKEAADFPAHISGILMQNYASLSPTMRQSLVQNLVTMRNKDFMAPIT
jgi:protein SDA1